MNTIRIAELCHNVNRTYSASLGEDVPPEWHMLSSEARLDMIEGVKFIFQTNKTPEQIHEYWMKQKIQNGWVYGEEKNEEKKTHNYLVPYSELSNAQKTKDNLFKTICSFFKNW